jgi:hypothetical protein
MRDLQAKSISGFLHGAIGHQRRQSAAVTNTITTFKVSETAIELRPTVMSLKLIHRLCPDSWWPDTPR